MVSDAPLGAEPPGDRVRRIALGVEVRRLAGARDARDDGWPARCSPYAQALDRAWTEAQGDDDRVVADADRRRAGGALVHGLYLPARQDGVVMLLNTASGSFALRIDAGGGLIPVQVER